MTRLASIFQLVGGMIIAFGVALLSVPAGIIVAGIVVVLVGYLMEVPNESNESVPPKK